MHSNEDTARLTVKEFIVQKGKQHTEKCSQYIDTDTVKHQHLSYGNTYNTSPSALPPTSQQKQVVPGGGEEVQPVQYFSVFWEKQA